MYTHKCKYVSIADREHRRNSIEPGESHSPVNRLYYSGLVYWRHFVSANMGVICFTHL